MKTSEKIVKITAKPRKQMRKKRSPIKLRKLPRIPKKQKRKSIKPSKSL